MVMLSASFTEGTNLLSLSSRDSLPSCTSWSTTVATNVLVLLAMRTLSSVLMGVPFSISAFPNALTQVPSGVQIPTITPGMFWAVIVSSTISSICFSCFVPKEGEPQDAQASTIETNSRDTRAICRRVFLIVTSRVLLF